MLDLAVTQTVQGHVVAASLSSSGGFLGVVGSILRYLVELVRYLVELVRYLVELGGFLSIWCSLKQFGEFG
jgi:hypothetical protein